MVQSQDTRNRMMMNEDVNQGSQRKDSQPSADQMQMSQQFAGKMNSPDLGQKYLDQMLMQSATPANVKEYESKIQQPFNLAKFKEQKVQETAKLRRTNTFQNKDLFFGNKTSGQSNKRIQLEELDIIKRQMEQVQEQISKNISFEKVNRSAKSKPRPTDQNRSSIQRSRRSSASSQNQIIKVKPASRISSRHESLPKPGDDKQWSQEPVNTMRGIFRSKRREERQNSQKMFKPQKLYSFKSNKDIQNIRRSGSIEDHLPKNEAPLPRRPKQEIFYDFPVEQCGPKEILLSIIKDPIMENGPNMFTDIQMSSSKKGLMTSEKKEQTIPSQISVSPLKQSVGQKKQNLQYMMDNKLSELHPSEHSNPKIAIVQDTEFSLINDDQEVLEPNHLSNLPEEAKNYAELEQKALRDLQITHKNLAQIEANKKEQILIPTEEIKLKMTKKTQSPDQSVRMSGMSDWTSLEDSGIGERIDSQCSSSKSSGKHQVEDELQDDPGLEQQQEEEQEIGRGPPIGDNNASPMSSGGSKWSEIQGDDFKELPSVKQSSEDSELDKTLERIIKPKKQVKAQTDQKLIETFERAKFTNQADLIRNEINNNQKVLKNSQSTQHLLAESFLNRIEYVHNPEVISNNLSANPLKAGLVPEPTKIKERIHDLLLQYRLNNDNEDEMVSNVPQKNLKNEKSESVNSRMIASSIPYQSQKALDDLIYPEDGNKLTNFMQRQKSFILSKNKKLEDAKYLYTQTSNQELKFKPDISKSLKSGQSNKVIEAAKKPRKVDQFVIDMETKRNQKERKQKDRIKAHEKEIKKNSKQSYVSNHSRQILIKAGVDASKPSERKKKSIQIPTSSDESMDCDEGPRVTNHKMSQIQNELQSQNLNLPNVNFPSSPSQIYYPNMKHSGSQQVFSIKRRTDSIDLRAKYLGYEMPPSMQDSSVNSYNAQSQPNLQNSEMFNLTSPDPRGERNRKNSPIKVINSQSPGKIKSCQSSTNKKEHHLSSIIQNPFDHFMSNTYSSKKYLAFRKQKHDEAQVKQKSTKPRIMKQAEDSPYKKKDRQIMKVFQIQQRSSKKERDEKIESFLNRVDQNIVVKSNTYKLIEQKLKQPAKVEIQESTMNPKKILAKSNKIMFLKFKTEFCEVLARALKTDLLPQSINSFEFTQLITQLGCAKTSEMMDDNSKVFRRCEELWTCLSQTAFKTLDDETSGEHVSVDDTHLYLMSIFGIQGHPRMHVHSPLSPERNDQLPVGFLTEMRQLSLSVNCVEQIKQRFIIFNHNRTRFLIDKAQEKRERTAKEMFAENTFKPNLISQKMNERILDSKKSKDSPELQDLHVARSVQKDYQRFIDSKNFWIKYNQQIQERKQVDGCTFKPDIKKSESKVKSKNTYMSNYYTLGRTIAPSPFDFKLSDSESNPPSEIHTYEQREKLPKSRIDQLYLLSNAILEKRKSMSQKLSREEEEFEKQKEECTFKPQIYTKNYKPTRKMPEREIKHIPQKQKPQVVAQILKDQETKSEIVKKLTPKDLDDKKELKAKVEAIRIQSQDKMLERQKYAQMERKYKIDMNERSNALRKPPPKLDLKEVKNNFKKQESEKDEKPIMFIDIEIGDGEKDRISVYDNDSPTKLSKEFCVKHKFDMDTQDQLKDQIIQRIEKIKNTKTGTENKVKQLYQQALEDAKKKKSAANSLNNDLTPVDENRAEDSFVNSYVRSAEQEAGGRQMTQASSIRQFGNRQESKSIISNPIQEEVKQSVPQTEQKMQSKLIEEISPQKVESDFISPISDANSKQRKTQSNLVSKSIDRIKNFKNMLIDANIIEEELRYAPQRKEKDKN